MNSLQATIKMTFSNHRGSAAHLLEKKLTIFNPSFFLLFMFNFDIVSFFMLCCYVYNIHSAAYA